MKINPLIIFYTVDFIVLRSNSVTPAVISYVNYRYNSTGLDPWEGDGAGIGPGSAQRMSVDQIRAEQQQIIDDQDKGLDELSKALRRQQKMGLDMQDEIQEHNGNDRSTGLFVW